MMRLYALLKERILRRAGGRCARQRAIPFVDFCLPPSLVELVENLVEPGAAEIVEVLSGDRATQLERAQRNFRISHELGTYGHRLASQRANTCRDFDVPRRFPWRPARAPHRRFCGEWRRCPRA